MILSSKIKLTELEDDVIIGTENGNFLLKAGELKELASQGKETKQYFIVNNVMWKPDAKTVIGSYMQRNDLEGTKYELLNEKLASKPFYEDFQHLLDSYFGVEKRVYELDYSKPIQIDIKLQ